jgi:hypothetical protein
MDIVSTVMYKELAPVPAGARIENNMARKKSNRKTRKIAMPPTRAKRAKLAEISRLAAVQSQVALDSFAKKIESATREALPEAIGKFERVRRLLNQKTVGEIEEMLREKRAVGAPRSEKTGEFIELLARIEFEEKGYRPIARLFRPDLDATKAYDALRKFSSKYRKEISARVADLKSSQATL